MTKIIRVESLPYILMHKNIETAILDISKDMETILHCEILDKAHAPIGHNNETALKNWWKRRAVPNHQMNQAVLHPDQTNMEYMTKNLGLSLIDCYWIRPMNLKLTWEEVNLYTNDFKERDFSFSDFANCSPFKPSATTQGELQKRWVIDGTTKERYLVKGNHSNMYRQSINEVLASKLHTLQGMAHVDYTLIDLPTTLGDGIGCISKNFTTEELEFVPAYDVCFHDKQHNNESALQQYIRNCVALGIDKNTMQRFMDYQILSDMLLTNTDRHLLNLGILRNPNTLEFVMPAPIFDTGNAMFYNAKYNPDTVFDISVTSFYKTERKMLEQVKNREVLDVVKLPSIEEIKELYSVDPYAVVYLDNMITGYERKIEMLNAYQKGYSLNPRSANFYLSGCDLDSSDNFDLE